MNRNDIFNHKPCRAYFDRFGKLIIENATMYYYPNFKAKDINNVIPESDELKDRNRSFKIFIDDIEFANDLNNQGFSISITQPDPEGPTYHLLKCKVSYRFFDPVIVSHDNMQNHTINYHKGIIHEVDECDILPESVDLILSPSNYTVPGSKKEGVSAYVKEMHFFVEGNPFANKYGPVFDAGVHPEEDD